MRFVADLMLGKLARWLRILGYDTIYGPSTPLKDLVSLCNREHAMFLTRRKSLPEGVSLTSVFNICSEDFEEQLRRVIHHFDLDTATYLFTRCISCNVEVQPVEKVSLRGKIPERSFEGYDHFFQCPQCQSIYWGGTHRANTLRKLEKILSTRCDPISSRKIKWN